MVVETQLSSGRFARVMSGEGFAAIEMRFWKATYVMHIGGGGWLRNLSGVLRISRTAQGTNNGGGRADGVKAPRPVCTFDR
jgi:hypothetical protein